ncbi:MAG: Smr/MutS family protein [Polyangiaceae bacterium]
MTKGPKKDAAKDSPFAALGVLKARLAAEEEAKARAKAPNAKAAPRPAPRGTSKGVSKPTESGGAGDEVDFHRFMSGVTPLDGKSTRIPRSASQVLPGSRGRIDPRAATDEHEEALDRLRDLVGGGTRFEVSDDGHRVEGRRDDVPPDMMRKLRRGLFPVDARIDLHGLGAEDARKALTEFVRDKRARGERVVLVIHGKGEHSPRGAGILRGEMAAWLSQGAASDSVAAFATADREDGGEGATYVLLRRAS